jgi:hypothetical protein
MWRSYGISSAWYSITVTCDVSEAYEMLAPLSYQGNAEKRKPPGKLSKIRNLATGIRFIK